MTDALHGIDTEPTPPAKKQTNTRQFKFQFKGTGWEYFSIWVTNVFLSIITLGIYSAWARVRRLKYFYQNTHLDGSTFEFHGNPVAILKGRVLVFGLIFLSTVFVEFESMRVIGSLIMLLLFLLMPMLLMRSLRFRYNYSSYRGIRFRFVGKDFDAYIVFFCLPLVSLFSLGLLHPMTHQKVKEYAIHNGRFGNAKLRFTASIKNFYAAYLKILAVSSLTIIGLVIIVAIAIGTRDMLPKDIQYGTVLLMILAYAYFIFFMIPIAKAIFFNLYWNHTSLESNAFKGNLPIGRLVWIYFTNLLGIVVTLGFFTPFAQVRMAKVQMEYLSLIADDSFDQILAAENQEISAVGDAFADWFDIDIAL